MSYQPPTSNDPWEGFEETQPKQRSRLLWAGLVVGIVVLVCICLASVFVLVRQFTLRTSPPSSLPPPPTPLIMPTQTAVSSLPITPTATLPLAATATLATSPLPVTRPPAASNVEAAAAPSAPAIDGNLNEWTGIGAYESRYQVFSAPSWNGTDDLTAVWQLTWDNANLYIAVTVTDDVHVQTQTGNQIFRGDSVDMQFETNLARASSQVGPTNFQITFSPGDFAGLMPSAFRFQGTNDGQMLDAPGGHHITIAAQKTAVGYNLEAAIPWSDLNVTPSPGLVMGIALNANDNDTPGTAVQEVMKSHVSTRTFTNPTTWGTLTLR